MEHIGIVGYALATLAYLIFLFLLLVIRNKSTIAKIIVVCSFFSFSAMLAASFQIYLGFPLKIVFALESLKILSYTALLIATQSGIKTIQGMIVLVKDRQSILVIFLLCFLPLVATFFPIISGKYIFLAFLVLNLWLIVLLEQLYRNADAKTKWALWPLIISMGMTSIFDFVIFSQATMVVQLDFDFWHARGYVVALSVPFFLISSRRIKQWSVNVFVSRDVVFHSSMLLIAGTYLLILAFAGYTINLIGGKWGNVLSIGFAALGIALLAALLLTEKLRREVKVFITKHFFANKYDYRIEWLKSIKQLAASRSDNFYKTALDIIGDSIHAQGGAILKKQPTGIYKTTYQQGLSLDTVHAKQFFEIDAFCQKHGWIIDLREYIYVENSYPDLLVDSHYFEQLHVDLIVPIIHDETLYGFFVFTLEDKRAILNWEDRDLLTAISKQLAIFLSFNEANIELSESKQFEAFHRMSAFLVHDLKNVQAQLSLINVNAEKHRDNPAFIDDVFDTISSATERLDKVLTQLRNKQSFTPKTKKVSCIHLVSQVIKQRNTQKPLVSLEVNNDGDSLVGEDLHSVLNHLVQNAQEATEEDGWVRVTVQVTDKEVEIFVADNGCGMSEKFIQNRLFKPFDTTKGNAGMGIGVYEAKQYIESIGGDINVESTVDKGSTFTLSLPVTEQ